jgi:hypothetical protein
MRKTYFQPEVDITRIALDSLILAGSSESTSPEIIEFHPGEGDGGAIPGSAI